MLDDERYDSCQDMHADIFEFNLTDLYIGKNVITTKPLISLVTVSFFQHSNSSKNGCDLSGFWSPRQFQQLEFIG